MHSPILPLGPTLSGRIPSFSYARCSQADKYSSTQLLYFALSFGASETNQTRPDQTKASAVQCTAEPHGSKITIIGQTVSVAAQPTPYTIHHRRARARPGSLAASNRSLPRSLARSRESLGLMQLGCCRLEHGWCLGWLVALVAGYLHRYACVMSEVHSRFIGISPELCLSFIMRRISPKISSSFQSIEKSQGASAGTIGWSRKGQR